MRVGYKIRLNDIVIIVSGVKNYWPRKEAVVLVMLGNVITSWYQIPPGASLYSHLGALDER